MKKYNNLLDERQELIMLKIEHRGCWIAFWGLLIVIFVQILFLNASLEQLMGEWIVFFVLSVYITAQCISNGIWDRHLKADSKTAFLSSLCAGAIFGILVGVHAFLSYDKSPLSCLMAGLLSFTITFVLCLFALGISARLYHKKVNELEKESEEEENE